MIAKRSLLILAMVIAAFGSTLHVSRASLTAMEHSFDAKLARLWPEDPFLVLGSTRGVYLDNYGAVFTAEVNLATGPSPTPFHQQVTEDEKTRHRQTKLQRLPTLRQAMRESMTNFASSLDGVGPEEQIVIGVNLSCYPWENRAGIPTQILMQASKKKLLEAKQNGTEAPIRTQDF